MKKRYILPLFALTAGCTSADQEPVELTTAAGTELAEAVRGRVAGPPQSCVYQRPLGGNRSAGEGAIIFEGQTNGAVLYVNNPPAGCPELKFNRALITRTPTGQLCRGDIVTVADLTSGIQYGSCGLGDFTPYRRVR
ncbi:MAG TPA: hypothetical protein VF628_01880 [Allosphingosinicella sp.]|jgi:hypothetical protein